MGELREAMEPARRRLDEHPLYEAIQTVGQLRTFMEAHVFAVWDFMSLLKNLQARLTCVDTPWTPSAFPESRRLVNEIVLGEESDRFEGGFLSHFELYLRAMDEAGADSSSIRLFVEKLKRGDNLSEALATTDMPSEASSFVRTTFSMLGRDRLHATAAAFTFGREDLIPDMFRSMVKDLRRNFEGVGLFEYYLDRHIEVDGESHGPMARRMVEELCGADQSKWAEASAAAVEALEARIDLWDGILRRIQ